LIVFFLEKSIKNYISESNIGMSWLIPYTNSFLRTDKIIFNYLTSKKDTRVWVGTIEAIMALAYIRFRSGAKLRLQKGFRISNDHSHPVQVFDYKFNFQGIKRTFMGGSSMDLINLKTPLFHVDMILKHLKPENREIILRLALESINNLIDTYSKDILACEVLGSIQMILQAHLDNSDAEHLKQYIKIKDDYMDSPLTKKNIELWMDNIDILNKIATLLRKASDAAREGRNFDIYLADVRHYMEEIREKLENYLMEIPKGY